MDSWKELVVLLFVQTGILVTLVTWILNWRMEVMKGELSKEFAVYQRRIEALSELWQKMRFAEDAHYHLFRRGKLTSEPPAHEQAKTASEAANQMVDAFDRHFLLIEDFEEEFEAYRALLKESADVYRQGGVLIEDGMAREGDEIQGKARKMIRDDLPKMRTEMGRRMSRVLMPKTEQRRLKTAQQKVPASARPSTTTGDASLPD